MYTFFGAFFERVPEAILERAGLKKDTKLNQNESKIGPGSEHVDSGKTYVFLRENIRF